VCEVQRLHFFIPKPQNTTELIVSTFSTTCKLLSRDNLKIIQGRCQNSVFGSFYHFRKFLLHSLMLERCINTLWTYLQFTINVLTIYCTHSTLLHKLHTLQNTIFHFFNQIRGSLHTWITISDTIRHFQNIKGITCRNRCRVHTLVH
jgi:hypothetical protein